MQNESDLRSVPPSSPDALMLTQELFDELEKLYGKGLIEDFFEENKTLLYFIIIYLNEFPAGCGALKYFNPFTAEIKRMYVRKSFRGKGLSKTILNDLEKKAVEMNYRRAVLETGVRQPEAVKLYENSGYRRIACYGRFADDPESLCYEKMLQQLTRTFK